MKEEPVPLARDFEKLKLKLEREPIEQLVGKEVRICMRNGMNIVGTMISVSKYEVLVQQKTNASADKPSTFAPEKIVIVMKHAIDFIQVI